MLTAVIIGILLAVSWNIYHKLHTTEKNSREITQALDNVARLQKVLVSISNSAIAANDPLVPGQNTAVQTYENAIAVAEKEINPETLTSALPEYSHEIVRLHNYVQDAVLLQKSSVNPVAAAAPWGSAAGVIPGMFEIKARALLENIRQLCSLLYDRQMKQLYNYTRIQQKASATDGYTLAGVVLITLLLLVAFFVMVNQYGKERRALEKELQQAKEHAEDVSHSQTQFLSTINHSIRTPLNSAIGMSTLLMQTRLSDEQKQYVDALHQSNVSLLSVINDILVFSKIESGTLQLEQAPFVLKRCIEEVFSLLFPENNRLAVSYSIDPSVPVLIQGDHARLRQVLMNLIGNAVKQTEKGSVQLKVSLWNRDEDMVEIAFKITDTSLMQTHEENDDWFARQRLAHTTGSLATDQQGLGLSVSSRLVSLMGGTFKVETIAGKGNVLTFTIKGKVLDDETDEPMNENPGGDEELIDTKLARQLPLRILVVDDNEMNQFMLSSVLIKMGYPCVVARNGAEAVAIAQEGGFDIIFMDLHMPVMDGLEATRRIREYYVASATPVIIGLTANALMQEKETSLKAGLNDFLIKPYKPQDIQHVLIKWGGKVREAVQHPS